jgi:hypothetical protein
VKGVRGVPIENVYDYRAWEFWENGGVGYEIWTMDVDIPRQDATAVCALSWVEGAAFCGVAGYTKAGDRALQPISDDPAFGIPSYHASNVTSFLFIYGVSNGRASCSFTIFGW